MRTNKGAVIGLSVLIGVGALVGSHHRRFSEGGPSHYAERFFDRMSGERQYHHFMPELREELQGTRHHVYHVHKELRKEFGELYGHHFERHGDQYTITLKDGHKAVISREDLYSELQPILRNVESLPCVLEEQLQTIPKKDGKSWDEWGKDMEAWGSTLEQRMDAWGKDIDHQADELEKSLERYEVAP